MTSTPIDLAAFDLRLAVPDRGARKLVRRPEAPRDLGGPQVGLLRLRVPPRPHLGRARAEQDLAAQTLVSGSASSSAWSAR